MLGFVYIGFLIIALVYTIYKRSRQVIKRFRKWDKYIAIHGKEEKEIKKKAR